MLSPRTSLCWNLVYGFTVLMFLIVPNLDPDSLCAGADQKIASANSHGLQDADRQTQGVEQTIVFNAGQDGYHTYRIPALIVTKKGTLLAFCEARKNNSKDYGDIDLVLKRSSDNGQTWSRQQIVHEEGGQKNIAIGNPCPVVDQTTGVIWLPFNRNNSDVLVTHSKDDGKTWAKPINITKSVKKPTWGWYATGPGVGIQLQRGPHKGRLVIACDHRKASKRSTPSSSHVFFSDDHGKTWELGGTVAEYTNECQLIERTNGDLLINMRNYAFRADGKRRHSGIRAVSLSKDGGKTWGPIYFDKTLIEPVCQASLIRYRWPAANRKGILVFGNPASKTRRENLTIRLSYDDGNTWAHSRTLNKGPSAYSCLAKLPDGSIGCLYETGNRLYREIRFAKFPLEWVEGGR
ncbi:MAG: exo-alpha-sialidase [Gemmataceae bacterium]